MRTKQLMLSPAMWNKGPQLLSLPLLLIGSREVTTSYTKGEWIKELMEQMVLDPDSKLGYTLRNGQLRYKERMVIGEDKASQT